MSTLLSIGLGLQVLLILIGMVANGFIVLFICIDWFRSRKLSPTDLILCCLGLSRFMLQVIVFLNVVMISFFKCIYLQHYVSFMLIIMWLFTNSVNLWFAAWLSVLYFVKIAIFSHPVFLRVKQRFSGLVPWLLLRSVVFSATGTIIGSTNWTYISTLCHTNKSLLSNGSYSAYKISCLCHYFDILLSVPNVIPFLLFLSSSIFLISSLSKHLRSVQHNGTCAMDLNTQAHLTAIKALASFTVLYLSSFVASISEAAMPWVTSEHHWVSTVLENVSAMYPAGHAIILIAINPKLKQAWVRMLHRLKWCGSEAPS